MEENKLSVIDGESLMELELSTPQFCIRSLLPQGLCKFKVTGDIHQYQARNVCNNWVVNGLLSVNSTFIFTSLLTTISLLSTLPK